MHDPAAMRLALATLLAGCAVQHAPVGIDPAESGGGDGKADGGSSALPDVRCSDAPDAGPAAGFDHWKSNLVADLGDPVHRGLDLVASADADDQLIEGDASYGPTDKALEDEQVDLFACKEGAWQPLGSVRTDGEGHFALALSGDARLSIGLRDMYASIAGDRTGARFVAYVAPANSELAVSDVDGTLTSSENAYAGDIVLGLGVDAQPGAAAAFSRLAHAGYQPVYVTARARVFTASTRAWLADQHFPRGPVRLSPGVVLPGGATQQYKSDTLAALQAADLAIAIGNGNRATDVAAYQSAGVPADRITMKLPEYTDELQPLLDAGAAIGFSAYDAYPIP